jgi:hypothetical protein
MIDAIAGERLENQRIINPLHRRPADVVTWLGAVQAQEYLPAKWALALRMRGGGTNDEIERALDDRRIIRTHVMRPTWHFVPAADAGWMLELTGPRVHRVLSRYYPQHGIDTPMCTCAAKVFERALRDGRHLTRAELGAHLARAGVKAKGIKLALLTIYAELERVICNGKRRGKQLTYALFEERVSKSRHVTREEALAELTRRYFRSHGPATIRDFVWWSGLTTGDAKRGLEMIRARKQVTGEHTYWSTGATRFAQSARSGVYLLPIYDEYTVAYRDLAAVPRAPGSFGRLQQALVSGGQVVGTWRAVANKRQLKLEIAAGPLSRPEQLSLRKAQALYERFLGIPFAGCDVR